MLTHRIVFFYGVRGLWLAAFGTRFKGDLSRDGEEKKIPKSDFQSPHHLILYLSVTYKYFQQQSKKIFKRVALAFLLQLKTDGNRWFKVAFQASLLTLGKLKQAWFSSRSIADFKVQGSRLLASGT